MAGCRGRASTYHPLDAQAIGWERHGCYTPSPPPNKSPWVQEGTALGSIRGALEALALHLWVNPPPTHKSTTTASTAGSTSSTRQARACTPSWPPPPPPLPTQQSGAPMIYPLRSAAPNPPLPRRPRPRALAHSSVPLHGTRHAHRSSSGALHRAHSLSLPTTRDMLGLENAASGGGCGGHKWVAQRLAVLRLVVVPVLLVLVVIDLYTVTDSHMNRCVLAATWVEDSEGGGRRACSAAHGQTLIHTHSPTHPPAHAPTSTHAPILHPFFTHRAPGVFCRRWRHPALNRAAPLPPVDARTRGTDAW